MHSKQHLHRIIYRLEEKRLYLTFYQVRAQQISYTESLQSTLAAQLELKASELINTIKPFVGGLDLQTLSQLQFTISANYAQYNLSSNQGTLDASIGNLNVREFSIKQCTKTTECLAGAYQKSVPIINSRVNFIKLRDKFE